MIGIIIDILIMRGMLIRDESDGQQVMINYRDTNRFSIGQRISIIHNGIMSRSFPPQITALSIQILQPAVTPIPPIGHIRPPAVTPPVEDIRPPVPRIREMRARVVRRARNFLIVQNNANNQILRADTDNARLFRTGMQVIIRYRGIIPECPPWINVVDIYILPTRRRINAPIARIIR